MSEIVIRTNNVPRDIVEAFELTEKEKEEIGDIPFEDSSFFRYKGNLYDLDDFTLLQFWQKKDSFEGWDGILADTFFSGILIRLVMDDYNSYEKVVVGNYYC